MPSNRNKRKLNKMLANQANIALREPIGLPAPFERGDGFVKGISANHVEFPSGSGGSLKGRGLPLFTGYTGGMNTPIVFETGNTPKIKNSIYNRPPHGIEKLEPELKFKGE